MSEAPKSRWFRFSLRELFFALTAIACALGWAHEVWTRPRGMLLDQAIKMVGESDELQVDCQNEKTPSGWVRVTHWIVRRRQPLPPSP